jgi:hypothetical protein
MNAMTASAGAWLVIAAAATILATAVVCAVLWAVTSVTGRGRQSVPISAPRPVALSLNSTRPVFIPPHIVRPISEGTPAISLAFERRARRHLAAVNGSEAA